MITHSGTILCPSHSYPPRQRVMKMTLSGRENANEAFEGVDDAAWDVFDYFGEL